MKTSRFAASAAQTRGFALWAQSRPMLKDIRLLKISLQGSTGFNGGLTRNFLDFGCRWAYAGRQ
jgi:hypothetical protein